MITFQKLKKLTALVLLLITLSSCGLNEKGIQIDAQRAINSYIDSLERDVVLKAKIKEDSIRTAQEEIKRADSLQQIFVKDSIKIARKKYLAWKSKQENNVSNVTKTSGE